MAGQLHYAPDSFDVTRTACGASVGHVLTELDDNVTPDKDEVLYREGIHERCEDCKEALKAEGS